MSRAPRDRRAERLRLRAARVDIGGRLVAVKARKHGTVTTYWNHGCECKPCMIAIAAHSKKRRQVDRERGAGDRRCAAYQCRCRVPRREGESPSQYRRRSYCDEHRNAAKAPPAAVWRSERRSCAREECDVVFTPAHYAQNYHEPACRHAASAARRSGVKERETKVCACPCQQVFERPSGISAEAWERRRFVDAEHRARGAYVTGAKPKKPTATGEPGASRAGRRKAPRPVPSKDRGPAPQPGRSVFGDASPVAPWRPPTPVVVRIERASPRPRFGLSRVS